MARGYGAPRGRRGKMARVVGAPRGRRVDLARVFGAPRGRRVETSPVCQSITTDEDEVLAEGVQIGRGEKRKSAEQDEQSLQGEYYYHIENVKKHHSKKFRMTATDHVVRFNNVLRDVDLLESIERTQAIFHHLLNDITWDMDKEDRVRFVLRSEQLDTPISIPFLPVEQLTTERIFSQIERVHTIESGLSLK